MSRRGTIISRTRDVFQVQRAQNHLLLRSFQHPQVAAGADDQLQFLRRVHSGLAHRAHAECLQHAVRRCCHEGQQRRRDPHEEIHRPGDRKRNPLGSLQSDGFRNYLAQDHVHVGDQSEREYYGDGVGVNMGVRQIDEERFQYASHGSFADPAQSQAGERYSELHRVDEVIKLLMQLLDGAGAHACAATIC